MGVKMAAGGTKWGKEWATPDQMKLEGCGLAGGEGGVVWLNGNWNGKKMQLLLCDIASIAR